MDDVSSEAQFGTSCTDVDDDGRSPSARDPCGWRAMNLAGHFLVPLLVQRFW